MMAAYRLRGLGWFTSCAGIVLSFYLVSLQVAHERNKLDALNIRILTAERDIRALETEFDTRANLQQLERWNGDILALSAPVASQFVADERRLASVSFDAPAIPGGEGEMRTAALVVPSLPVFEAMPDPAQAAPVQVAAAPQRRAAPAGPDASATANRVARAPAPSSRAVAAAPSSPAPRPAQARVQRVAMLDGGLLADLGARARAEASR